MVSWQEAAAMPHDKLLQLVRALQLDVKALQTELEGGWGVVFLVARGTWHFAALHAVQLGSLSTQHIERRLNNVAAVLQGRARRQLQPSSVL